MVAPWVSAPCKPEYADQAEADAALLRSLLRVDELPRNHIVRECWTTASPLARAVLHHLAGDLRACETARGFKRAVKGLRNDARSFEDRRYEVRIAAAIARGANQRILELAAERKGPDVRAVTRSGHELGIACYRASSLTPDFQRTQDLFEKVATEVLILFREPSLQDGILLAVELPEFPLRHTDATLIRRLIRRLWSAHDRADVVEDGVRVCRAPVPRAVPLLDGRGMRLRFALPIARWEDDRLERHVLEKVAHEERAWARAYAGVSAFFIEQSNYSDFGKLKAILETRAQSAGAFAFYAVTSSAYGDFGDGLPHSFEELDPVFPRPTPEGFGFNFETFGDNRQCWAAGDFPVEMRWEHAVEEYDLRQVDGVHYQCTRRKALGSGKRIERVRAASFVGGADSPEFKRAVARAVANLRAERVDDPMLDAGRA